MPDQKNEFVDYVVSDLLGDINNITTKKMFGAYGLFCDNAMFGLIDKGEFYIKTSNSATVKKLKTAGSAPFTYRRLNQVITIQNYWLVPADFLENRDQLKSILSLPLS